MLSRTPLYTLPLPTHTPHSLPRLAQLRLHHPLQPLPATRMFSLTPYRADQPKTLAFQKSLPRLPVPNLDASLARYVTSLRPLLMQQALEGGHDSQWVENELDKRRKVADDFGKQGGLGRKLQHRLIDVDKQQPSNWLDDKWWIQKAYQEWRVPLPINSNWWILMQPDEGLPRAFRESIPPPGEFTPGQLKRAAKLSHRLVDFKLKLDRQDILPDSSRAGPFCMHQYTRVFGVTRIPSLPHDGLVGAQHPNKSNFVVVMALDHFYKVHVIEKDGLTPVPLDEIERRLGAVAADALSRGRGEGVGACTGDGRDEWTAAREHLLELGERNAATISAVEECLFVVSLDAHTLKSELYQSSSVTKDSPDLEAHILNASIGSGHGRNRWWDKGISISVESNGRGGMLGEHSPVDALIPSIVCDYVLAEHTDSNTLAEPAADTPLERLDWTLDDEARQNIAKAEKTIASLAADSDGRMLWFDEYAVDWIKAHGKQSPDAYIQMALQLAWHKDQGGKPTATYETASTRLFLHGRTDVIRTLSQHSWAFVQAVADGKRTPQDLYKLLTAATTAHNQYTKDASTGKGCDRHFMGLRLLMREGEKHALFEDELFAASQEWVLSTSSLSAGDRFFGTGFGTVWPNGYGINYLTGKSVLKFGIESKRSCATTDTERFRRNLTDALREMRSICELGQVEGAKL